MRSSIRLVLVAIMLALPLLGCQKASNTALIDETIDVPSQQTRAKIIDGPNKDQKVSVSAQSSTAEFSIYVVLEKDREGLENKLINLQKTTGSILAQKEKTKDAALEATIPAKQDFAIVISNGGGKSTQVKLKVTNVP